MIIAHKRNQNKLGNLQIFMVSAWGFTIVISSLLFLLVGRWFDTKFNTEPLFMVGLCSGEEINLSPFYSVYDSSCAFFNSLISSIPLALYLSATIIRIRPTPLSLGDTTIISFAEVFL